MISTVARVGLRELSRRPLALLLVTALPLAFYVVRADVPGQAIRFLSLGVGWAVATLALFTHVSARHLDRRLGLVGAAPTALFLGRQAVLVGVGLAMAVGYFALVAASQDISRLWAVGLLLGTTSVVAGPLGAMVSLLVPRELEGALALLVIMAMQMLADPNGTIARFLPLWSTRELGTFAIDATDTGYLVRGLTHFAATALLCLATAWTVSVIRLRPVRLPVPRQG
jgi:hypothetical protein